MGVLDRKAPQQLAGKTVGIKISIFGNSSWPLTARNGPKRAVLGPFWGRFGASPAACGRRENLLLSSIAEPLNFSALPPIPKPQMLT